MDKSEKYYDEVNLYPKSTYSRDNGTKTKLKTIRLTQEEIDTWREMKLSKTIHEILSGENQSNDSIKISKLKTMLSGLYAIMNDENKMKAIEGSLTPQDMELLLNIEEVVYRE